MESRRPSARYASVSHYLSGQDPMLIHRLAYEFPAQRPPVAIAAAKPTIARTTSAAALTIVARPPANEVAYPALSRLLDDVAIRIAAAIAPLGIPEVPPCARLRTKGSISVTPTTAASQ